MDAPAKAVHIPFRREGDSDDQAFSTAVEDSLSMNLDQPLCKVLAVGPDVGKPRSKKDLRRLRLVSIEKGGKETLKDVVFTGKVGDFVGLPEHAGSGRMLRGVTGWEYDLLVDEGELHGAYLPEGEVA